MNIYKKLLKNRLGDIKYFFWLFKNWHNLKKDGYSLVPFLRYWILYFLPRLFYGRSKSVDISKNIISRFKNNNLIIPLPIKNKPYYYIGLRDSGDFYMFREVCVDDDYNISQIKPGMIIVDAGAHIGTFTISVSKIIGEKGKVIAIEPEGNSFGQLTKNLELNKIKNVIPINIGLSDFNRNKDFFIDKESACSSFTLKPDRQIINKLIIKVKTLDSLLQEINIDKINFLKIDTEGAEPEILKGAQQTLIKNPQMKMVIAAYHYPEEKEEVFQCLKSLKFSPRISGDLVVVE
jgi:FkbM family methyltransferase